MAAKREIQVRVVEQTRDREKKKDADIDRHFTI